MQQPEERWQRFAYEVGLANATRLIMAENPGRGDSVSELDSIWEDMDVFQIFETILSEGPSRLADPEITGLWGDSRAGANAFCIPPILPVDGTPARTYNSPLRR